MGHFPPIVFLLLTHLLLSNSYSRSCRVVQPANLVKSSRRIKRSTSTELQVVEHLVDCTTNPALAEIYGGLANDFCLQRDGESSSSLFRGLGGLVEQAVTIGFLVMSYFFFKRTANGISEWEDDDDDDDEVTYNSNESNSQESFRTESRQCPQCNGRGKFEFDGIVDSAPICDLCGGSGSIVRSERAKTLGLPMSSRQLWSEPNSDGLDSDEDRTLR